MPDTPINQALWEVTLPAVRAAWDAGRAFVEPGNKYVPRIARRSYKENESGWPSTLAASSLQPVDDDGYINWREMFGPRGERSTRVPIEDVPELCAATDEVAAAARRDPQFASRINAFAHAEDEEWRESQLRLDYQKNFVAEIIARADATSADSDAALLEIYLQVERARFSTTLEGDLVVPLVLTDFGSDQPIDLSPDVCIERLSEDVQCARAPDWLLSSGDRPYLSAAATHAVVARGITIDNSNYFVRKYGGIRGLSPLSDSDIDKIDRAVQVIHVVTGAKAGYKQMLVRPHGWADDWTGDLPPLWSVESRDNYPATDEYPPPWQIQRQPLDGDLVKGLTPAYGALTTAPKWVRLAGRRVIRAMMRTDDEDRTLDAMIGIEALLLENQPELRYRMALRAAAALAAEFDPATIFGIARNVYDHRSEIAHGGTPKKATFSHGGETWRSADIAPFLLRALLRNYLLSPKPWTKDELDDRVLAALAQYNPDTGNT